VTRPAPAFLPAPRRLRLVRWRLTALFTLTSAAALVLLGLLVIRTEGASVERDGHDRRLRRADTARALVYYDRNDVIALDGFRTDPVLEGPPQLFVVQGVDRRTAAIVLTGADTGLGLDEEAVRSIAVAATRDEDRPTERTVRTASGTVDLLAEPFYDAAGDRPAGAVVVAAGADAGRSAQRRLVVLVLSGIAGLTVVLAAAGYWLSGISLRPAEAALRRQERFLAEVAHDLRTPIAALATITAAARLPGAEQQRLQASATLLTGRLARTIDDLLTRAQLSAGTWPLRRLPTRVDLLVEQICDETAATWPQAQITGTGDALVADLDPTLIARAIGNLVDNAVRHHGPGRARVVVASEPGRITVTDDGPGMPTPDADAQPDGSARPDGGRPDGTAGQSGGGLGLAIAEAVATAHGGALTVGPGPNGGTVVELRYAQA